MAATPGGYKRLSLTDKGMLDAAKFGVDAIPRGKGLELHDYEVLAAESQIVAGVNYRIVISLDERKPNAKSALTPPLENIVVIIVWVQPDKKQSVTMILRVEASKS